MRFHQESGGDASVPGTPVIRMPLEPGVMGEANMDGSIYVSNIIEPGSKQERQTVSHEMRHATDIRLGKLTYGDNHIEYNGENFPRETIKGVDMVKIEGKWKPVGSTNLPWEHEAY